MKWRLGELLGEYQSKTGKDLIYGEIHSETGIAPSTLSAIRLNKVTRADFETIERLINYFSAKLNRQLQINDLLIHVPD